MSARKINPFKGTNVLYRLRAKAKTGVQSPGWTMAAVTAVPPSTLPPLPSKVGGFPGPPPPRPHDKLGCSPRHSFCVRFKEALGLARLIPSPFFQNHQVPKLTLPTDRLLAAYERRFPESGEEPTRAMDGRVVNRSMVFVQQQHAFMQQGHSEQEAFGMAEKALAEEEARALKQLEEMTAEARKLGAVPALSTLQAHGGDGRGDRLQFWRGELERTPYESWGPGKRASLDHWLARQLLGWEPHQTRYLGRAEFRGHLQAVRELVFADAIQKQRAAGPGALRAAGLSEEEVLGLRQEQALAGYREWEAKLAGKRAGEWSGEETAALLAWLDEHAALVLTGVEDAHPTKVEGGVADQERRKARLEVLQYMAFPLLRPELQGVPYLSRYLLRAFSAVARQEAAAGLRPLLHGPLGKRKADYAAAEQGLNDALPKLVVKTFVSVCLERPFAWKLLRRSLLDRLAGGPGAAAAAAALAERLPELQGLGSPAEVAGRVEEAFEQLTDVLTTLASDDDTSALSQDIGVAYQAINDLHRVAQELLHVHVDVDVDVDGAAGSGSGSALTVDAEIEAEIRRHHGWVDEDLAIGEALRRAGDAAVQRMFGTGVPEAHLRQEAAREQRESDVLEAARLDFALHAQNAGRQAWERGAGLDVPDAYDAKWLARESPCAELEVETVEEDIEEYVLDARDGGLELAPGVEMPAHLKSAQEEEEEEEEEAVALALEAEREALERGAGARKGGARLQVLEAAMSEAERQELLEELKALNIVKQKEGEREEAGMKEGGDGSAAKGQRQGQEKRAAGGGKGKQQQPPQQQPPPQQQRRRWGKGGKAPKKE
jgi:hypothetical protein